MNPQKLISLKIENVLRVIAAEITPDKPLVVVSGKNGNGKSSCLTSVAMLFGGKDTVPDAPIHTGKTKGQIIGETEDLIITRKFSQSGGTTLVVTTKDGVPMKSPQAILDSLTSSLSFDPLAFDRMAEKEPAKAIELLRKLVGLDFTALNAKRKQLFDNRTLVGREVDQLKAKVDGYVHDASAPAEEVSVAELSQKIQDAQRINAERAAKRNELVSSATARMENHRVSLASKSHLIDASTRECNRLKEEIARLQAQAERELARNKELVEASNAAVVAFKASEEAVESAKKQAAEIVDEDISALTAQLSTAEETNQKVRSNKRRAELVAQHKAKSDEYDNLTSQIEAIDKDKEDQLAKAKFPMENLSFSDAGVLLDGVPWKQGSTAERLRASIAMGAALNPTLRVILVRSGNDLDNDAMELVAQEAENHNLQIWLEKIDGGKHTSVVIEDGTIKD